MQQGLPALVKVQMAGIQQQSVLRLPQGCRLPVAVCPVPLEDIREHLPDLGLSSLAAVLAIGSGTLMGNHYNNSGFWVMGQFFHLNTKQSVKYVTVPCAVASVICLIAVVILNAVGVFG